MEEQVRNRGLEDISHYFLTEEKEASVETVDSPPVQSTSNPSSSSAVKKNLFILGSDSKEGRAVLASNLACEWSLQHKEVELIEEEKDIHNSHFFVGGVSTENGNAIRLRLNGSGSIELTKWDNKTNLFLGKKEWVVWNVGMESISKLVGQFDQVPTFVVLLEDDRKKMMQAYLDVRRVLAFQPASQFHAIRYSNHSEKETRSSIGFFQQIARKFLNIEVADGGQITKDLFLAKSILRRYPVVLFPEEHISAKNVLKQFARTLIQDK